MNRVGWRETECGKLMMKRLRDLSTEQEAELKQKVKTLESDLSVHATLTGASTTIQTDGDCSQVRRWLSKILTPLQSGQ